MKSWVSCRGSMWIYWPRHIWPMPPYQSRCFPAQLVSPWNWPGWCRSERGIEGEWRCCSHNSLGFFGWTTETEHRNKKDWLILALVLFSVSLSSLVFKPWPSMWHGVWITSATSCHKNFFKNPERLLPKKSIDFSPASDYHSLNMWNSNLPPKLNRNKLWIELMKFNECLFCTIT